MLKKFFMINKHVKTCMFSGDDELRIIGKQLLLHDYMIGFKVQ